MKKNHFISCIVITLLALVVSACNLGQQEVPIDAQQSVALQTTTEAEETADVSEDNMGDDELPPFTPLATLTPSETLRPPPTFEPPTLTPSPTVEPSLTPEPTVNLEVNIPGLQGLWTETPQPGEETCEPRDDWTLEYQVQPGDALASIAARYNTFTETLAEGNCLDDPSLIRVDQRLLVPGEAHPGVATTFCEPWELLTPFNGAVTIPGEGTITFNWRGPEALRYLVRVWQNDNASGDFAAEYLVELRNDYTLDLSELPDGGVYSWRVYPLGRDFLQIGCPESHYSVFSKAEAPPTPSGLTP